MDAITFVPVHRHWSSTEHQWYFYPIARQDKSFLRYGLYQINYGVSGLFILDRSDIVFRFVEQDINFLCLWKNSLVIVKRFCLCPGLHMKDLIQSCH